MHIHPRGKSKASRGSFSAVVVLCRFCLTACTRVDPDGDVNGSVFIVTAGAGSYKFGLVKVYFCPEDDLTKAIKPISDEFSKQDKEKYLATQQAESDRVAASSAVEAALSKQSAAGIELRKYVDAAKGLSDFEGSVDQMKTVLARMIQKERPDLAKDWDGATTLSNEVMDELYLRSQKIHVSLPDLVRVFICVSQESDRLGKSLRDQLEMSERLGYAIQSVEPMSDSPQFTHDILNLFDGQSDTAIGHAIVGPQSGIDSGNNKSVETEYQTAARADDKAGIYSAVFAGSVNQIQAYEASHPDARLTYDTTSLSQVGDILKRKAISPPNLQDPPMRMLKKLLKPRHKQQKNSTILRPTSRVIPESRLSTAWL